MKYLCVALIPLLAACSPGTEQPATPPATPVATAQPQQQAQVMTSPVTIDFTAAEDSAGVLEITGMSGAEPWGRWSIEEEVRIRFEQALPKQFTLDFTARAFGPNVDVPIVVRAGDGEASFRATGTDQAIRLSFKLSEPTDTIAFTGLSPTSPASQGLSADPRTLGVGIGRLTVTPAATAR
jgi:phosphoglycerol transferase